MARQLDDRQGSTHPRLGAGSQAAAPAKTHRRLLLGGCAAALLGLLALAAPAYAETQATGEAITDASSFTTEEAYPGRTGPGISVSLTTPAGPRTFDAMLIDGELVAEGDLILGSVSDSWDAVNAAGEVVAKGTLDALLGSEISGAGATLDGSPLDKARLFDDTIAGLVRTDPARYWRDGVVPYTIADGLSEATLQRIANAIAHWRSETRIELVPRSTQADYVVFTPVDTGCNSTSLGRRGERQDIRLSTNCSYGTIVHEIGHAVGLFHEHTRPDRDSFVRIHWKNIEADRERNFRRVDDELPVGAYDFGSIMHYGAFAFSDNNQATISRRDGEPLVVQRQGLSDGDIAAVQAMYDLEPLIEAGDQAGDVLAQGDFNGDGLADLAIGIPGEDLELAAGTRRDAGMVQILYGQAGSRGAAGGLDTTASQVLHQDLPGVLGVAENNDRFGERLAAGDLNGDGYDDLAVGIPSEDLLTGSGNILDAGVVHVFHGSRGGISTAGNKVWHQDVAGVAGILERGDRFGDSLAIGDLNGDGYADLATGATGEDLSTRAGNIVDAGVVHVLYGRRTGLTATGSQLWNQDTQGVHGVVEAYDRFGDRLAIGDLSGDGYAELVVGVPGEDLRTAAGNIRDAGAVHILYGRRGSLTATNNHVIDQDKPGILGVVERGDRFGDALAIADFNADRYGDLAVGVPYEDLRTATTNVQNAGVVQVLYGRRGTLTSTGNQVWDQDKPGMLGGIETNDLFGYRLAAGDMNRDGFAELAVGIPHEDLYTAAGNIRDAGVAQVIFGSRGKLVATGNQVWDQDKPGMAGIVEAYDNFAKALTIGDFGGDGSGDLAIGVPGEDLQVGATQHANAGFVQVIRGNGRNWLVTRGLAWNPLTGAIESAELVLAEAERFAGDPHEGEASVAAEEREATDPPADAGFETELGRGQSPEADASHAITALELDTSDARQAIAELTDSVGRVLAPAATR